MRAVALLDGLLARNLGLVGDRGEVAMVLVAVEPPDDGGGEAAVSALRELVAEPPPGVEAQVPALLAAFGAPRPTGIDPGAHPGAILAAGFGVCALSDFARTARFGTLSVAAIVLAVVGDFLLLPALLGSTPRSVVGRLGRRRGREGRGGS